MQAEEKIFKVLERIKGKLDISPANAVVDYRAGYECDELGADDEIKILNKLASEGVIEVVNNFSSEYQ